ncbi:MAG: hypothetical protein V4671_19575 [Armatimonadota bacterium]
MAQRALQLNLPGSCRVDKKARPPKRSEAALQQQARATMGLLGYASMETGQGRPKVKCPCGCNHSFTPGGYMGNSLGLPDVLFYRMNPAFPPVFVPVEMKTETGIVSPAQKLLADQGRSQVARSILETVQAVKKAEEFMDQYRFSPEKRAQIERLIRESGDKLW